MRGTGPDPALRGGPARFSPAHAGNSRRSSPSGRRPSVQPRACGEQAPGGGMIYLSIGSAPRMRGTGSERHRQRDGRRFSPAHAGNSHPRASGSLEDAVQPRACGEQPPANCYPARNSGSAPRMRGTADVVSDAPQEVRFSPAHAGNSPSGSSCCSRRSVQPRACGEQFRTVEEIDAEGGSAPRMRGTGRRRPGDRDHMRFSPAHAGNSRHREGVRPHRPVQPRACGEQIPKRHGRRGCSGSAPRMRGTGDPLTVAWRQRRFSPAHAGNRSTTGAHVFDVSVQPRACGEQARRVDQSPGAIGSAPRMRGTVDPRLVRCQERRFSPAHAGNRSSRP